MYKKADISLCDVIKMMSKNPAKFINAKTKGSIALYYDADIVIFDDDINVSMTMVEGKVVYRK